MGKERSEKYYDDIYRKHFKNNGKYNKAPEENVYYKLWSEGLKHIKNINPEYIVDLGCGPGHMEEILAKETNLTFKKCIGYDFSNVAINQCINKLDRNKKFKFKIADLTKLNLMEDLKTEYNFSITNTLFISYEFLEHINADIEILSQLPSGSTISFSVPSYDSAGHVRFFKSIDEVIKHYNGILKIINITTMNLTKKNINDLVFVCLAVRK